jgi:hypothetical protein
MQPAYHYVKGNDAVQVSIEATHPEIAASLAAAIDNILMLSGFQAKHGKLAGSLFAVKLAPSGVPVSAKGK